METIIIWIVIVVAGAFFERLKKKTESDESKPQRQPARNRARTPRAAQVTPAPAPAQPSYTAAHRQQPDRTAAPERPKPFIQAPSHEYQPIKITENDAPMQVEVLDDETAPEAAIAHAGTADPARRAHYDRWRQAILDTQILERKF